MYLCRLSTVWHTLSHPFWGDSHYDNSDNVTGHGWWSWCILYLKKITTGKGKRRRGRRGGEMRSDCEHPEFYYMKYMKIPLTKKGQSVLGDCGTRFRACYYSYIPTALWDGRSPLYGCLDGLYDDRLFSILFFSGKMYSGGLYSSSAPSFHLLVVTLLVSCLFDIKKKRFQRPLSTV